MTAKSKRLARSFLYGAIVQAALLYAAVVPPSRSTGVLLWNAYLMIWLAGPMPRLGTGTEGQPIYEPLTVHFAAGILGLALGIVLYSLLIYRGLSALEAWSERRSPSLPT